jgi:hypothetical protein
VEELLRDLPVESHRGARRTACHDSTEILK